MMRAQIIKSNFLLIAFLVCLTNASAQSDAKLLEEYLALSLQNQPATEQEARLLKTDCTKLLQVLQQHQNDSLEEVRTEVYRLAYKCGMNTNNGNQRRAAVSFLAKNMKGETGALTGRIANYLADFTIDDFDAESKYLVGQLARNEVPYRARIIKLTGFLQLEESIYNYKKELGEGKVPFKIKWAMNLAMARMNDADAIDYVTNKIKALPVSDNVVYDLVPDLVYTRQPQAFNYLFEIINSDEKDCRSSNPSREAEIICAYRVLAMVAPYIKDFPLKQDASGGLDTDNYRQALITAREWIAANQSNYTLITEIY